MNYDIPHSPTQRNSGAPKWLVIGCVLVTCTVIGAHLLQLRSTATDPAKDAAVMLLKGCSGPVEIVHTELPSENQGLLIRCTPARHGEML